MPAAGWTLRVAVTQRCNLRCAYCMPATGAPAGPPPLPLETLAELVVWLGGQVPLEKVRVTGGEPTTRRGLAEFVRRLTHTPGAPEITMTTNGVLLEQIAEKLAAAGLRRVNVSLDTLDPDDFRVLTRGGDVTAARRGIRAALTAGLGPVKVNSVLRRSTWRRDVPALLDFALTSGVQIRFLELMRTGTEVAWAARELVTAAEVVEGLSGLEMISTPTASGPAPARVGRFRWRGHLLGIGWITPVSEPFCTSCNRLRMNSRGMLRCCLMESEVLDLAHPPEMRTGEPARWLARFLAEKRSPEVMATRLPMVSLGG